MSLKSKKILAYLENELKGLIAAPLKLRSSVDSRLKVYASEDEDEDYILLSEKVYDKVVQKIEAEMATEEEASQESELDMLARTRLTRAAVNSRDQAYQRVFRDLVTSLPTINKHLAKAFPGYALDMVKDLTGPSEVTAIYVTHQKERTRLGHFGNESALGLRFSNDDWNIPLYVGAPVSHPNSIEYLVIEDLSRYLQKYGVTTNSGGVEHVE